MTRKERYDAFVNHFTLNFPEAETELHYSNPYELLVAVVLSAQCTDKRVNLVTPALFKDYPDAATMARLFTVSPYDAQTQRLVTREWTRVKTGK